MPQNVDGRDESTGARPIGAPSRRPLLAWLIPLLVLLMILLVLGLLLRSCGGSSSGGTAAASPSAATTPPRAPATAATGAAPTDSASSGAGGSNGPGTITAQGVTVLPLSGSRTASLTKYDGQTAVTSSVQVQSVAADEGFWVGTSTSDRVWVQLTGKAGESPYTVKVGDNVTFTGPFIKNVSGFADQVGVTGSEGKAQLDAQGAHIDANKSSLKLAS